MKWSCPIILFFLLLPDSLLGVTIGEVKPKAGANTSNTYVWDGTRIETFGAIAGSIALLTATRTSSLHHPARHGKTVIS